MEPLAVTLALALAIAILFRRPGVFAPALAVEGIEKLEVRPPGDEEEQLPETDRAPRRWLPWSVAALALVRLVLLLTLRA